jgi:hypothetical protein
MTKRSEPYQSRSKREKKDSLSSQRLFYRDHVDFLLSFQPRIAETKPVIGAGDVERITGEVVDEGV